MRDPGDDTARQPTETLQVGSSRPPLFQKVPTQWRRPSLVLLTFALGVATGVAAVLGWPAPPRTALPPPHVHEHDVELVLFDVVPPRKHPNGRESGDRPLRVDGAVFLSGAVTSTVLGVDSLQNSLGVRATPLPATVSPTARLRSVQLEIGVRDCTTASRWTPFDRPFTITWRDEDGERHLDRAGDLDRPIARSLLHYIDAVCRRRS